MDSPRYNLAIETSGPVGSVSLGCGDQHLAEIAMPPQERHRVDLLPTIDQLTKQAGIAPADLNELYVSVGPGSFTGLRVGITSAKVLAWTLKLRVIAVPTLDVLAQQTPSPESDTLIRGAASLIIAMNMKKQTVYAGRFRYHDHRWIADTTPAVQSMEELLATSAKPVAILGHPLPPSSPPPPLTPPLNPPLNSPLNTPTDSSAMIVLPSDWARPTSRSLWQVARRMANQTADPFISPIDLVPLYVREPEAVELWDAKLAREQAAAK